MKKILSFFCLLIILSCYLTVHAESIHQEQYRNKEIYTFELKSALWNWITNEIKIEFQINNNSENIFKFRDVFNIDAFYNRNKIQLSKIYGADSQIYPNWYTKITLIYRSPNANNEDEIKIMISDKVNEPISSEPVFSVIISSLPALKGITPTPKPTSVPQQPIPVESLIAELEKDSEEAERKFEGSSFYVTGYIEGYLHSQTRGGLFFLVGDPNDYDLNFMITYDSTQTSDFRNKKNGDKCNFHVTCDTVGIYSGFICRYRY